MINSIEDAREVLDVAPGADAQSIERAHAHKKSLLESKRAQAPTKALKNKIDGLLEQLDEARAMLLPEYGGVSAGASRRGKKIAVASVVVMVLILGGIGLIVTTCSSNVDTMLADLLPMSAEENVERNAPEKGERNAEETAEETDERQAVIAQLQDQIGVVKQRLETTRQNLDRDVLDAERERGDDLEKLQHWQHLSENVIFSGSVIKDLEAKQSTAESLLRDEQFAESERLFNEIKSGYEQVHADLIAGEDLYAAEKNAEKSGSEWQSYARQYNISNEGLATERALKHFKEARTLSGEGQLRASLSEYRQATEIWENAMNDPAVEARIKKQEAQWEVATRQRKSRLKDLTARLDRQTTIGKLVTIPGGSYRMGNNANQNESPWHEVRIQSFKMMEHEVTWDQYQRCIDDEMCRDNRDDDEDKDWGSRTGRPVINVTWNDAQDYIQWLNKKTGRSFRLPSEAEWEYAARAGSGSLYNWGNSHEILCRYANGADQALREIGNEEVKVVNCNDGYGGTAPVKSFPPNEWGLYDMHGNVAEWVEDCYNGDYNGAPDDGSAWLSGDCEYRMLRGGSWGHEHGELRSAFRRSHHTRVYSNTFGFRLAEDL